MSPYPRTMVAGAAVAVAAAWRRLRRRKTKSDEKSPAEHGQARSAGQSPEALADSRTMNSTNHSAKSAPTRDESTADRPPLAAVPTVIDRRQHVEFFENQARANAGQWLASDDVEITEDRR